MSNSNLSKAEAIHQVAIFGSSHTKENSGLYNEVFTVCQRLAEAGFLVVDGGGPGAMRAATEGAHQGGGKAIGVTFYPKDTMEFEGRDIDNKFDEEIKTANYVERTLTLMKEGQVYVIFQGGTGTISEFGMAWGLAKLYFGHHKPLILYGEFWQKIIDVFSENMLLRPEELKVFKIVDSPQGVLQAINEFEKEIQRGEHEHLQVSGGDFTI